MAKRVLITGLAGQDAAYLAKAALTAGDEVWGTVRRVDGLADSPLARMGLVDSVRVVQGVLDGPGAVRDLLASTAPDEIYNLAGQSSVAKSFVEPAMTVEANALLPLHFLEALRAEGGGARFVQASTAEVFGSASGACDESAPIAPVSPYAVSKAFAQSMTSVYRASWGLGVSSAILFAHESPYRDESFLTRKVTLALARIRHGRQEVLELGNLSAARDWGYAGDYVEGLRLIAGAAQAEDFVLASGQDRTVREFVDAAGRALDFDLEWEGEGLNEVARDRADGRIVVRVNPAFFRPVDASRFLGDPSKAERVLGWRRTIDFEALVMLMARADDARVRDGAL